MTHNEPHVISYGCAITIRYVFILITTTMIHYTFVPHSLSVSCKLPSTPLISPTGGNMLGGTAITVTIASQCLKQITGTPQCVFDGNRMTSAVDDSALPTNGKHYYCSTPMFDRTGRITFEFRAQVQTNKTLSLFDTFYLGE